MSEKINLIEKEVNALKMINPDLDYSYVNDLETLEGIFVPVKSENGNVRCEIKTTNFTLVVFDNENFNETYLLKLLLTELENSREFCKKIKVVYVDSVELRAKYGFPEVIYVNPEENIEMRQLFEKTMLTPNITIINTLDNEVYYLGESKIAPISKRMVNSLVSELTSELNK